MSQTFSRASSVVLWLCHLGSNGSQMVWLVGLLQFSDVLKSQICATIHVANFRALYHLEKKTLPLAITPSPHPQAPSITVGLLFWWMSL